MDVGQIYFVGAECDKLVENAVSFAPAGSRIDLSVTTSDASVIVSVVNVGPALPRDAADELFQTFYSHRDESGGAHLGFGLYIARLIAEAHSATISARDTERDGETAVVFSIVFPAA